MNTFGFIGMGNMGRAMLNGLLKEFGTNQLLLTDVSEALRVRTTEETGVRNVPANIELANSVKYIILAVKPQSYDAVLKSITNVNLDTHVTAPAVRGRSSVGGYSGAAVKPIALRFMADLGADSALKDAHISGMGGIETWRDAVEFLLLGAGSLQVTTAVMQYGYRIIDDLLSGLRIYMAQRGYARISQLVGAAVENIVDLPVSEIADINNIGIYPITLSSIRFDLGPTMVTTGTTYKIEVTGIEAVYNNAPVGIEDVESDNIEKAELTIADGTISATSVAESIEIYNLAGQLISVAKDTQHIASPSAGSYIVKVTIDGKTSASKVIL